MQDVTIKKRSHFESHPEDVKLYAKLHALMYAEATVLRESGEFTDHQVIAIHTRTLQQMAANATYIADDLSVSLELEVINE